MTTFTFTSMIWSKHRRQRGKKNEEREWSSNHVIHTNVFCQKFSQTFLVTSFLGTERWMFRWITASQVSLIVVGWTDITHPPTYTSLHISEVRLQHFPLLSVITHTHTRLRTQSRVGDSFISRTVTASQMISKLVFAVLRTKRSKPQEHMRVHEERRAESVCVCFKVPGGGGQENVHVLYCLWWIPPSSGAHQLRRQWRRVKPHFF